MSSCAAGLPLAGIDSNFASTVTFSPDFRAKVTVPSSAMVNDSPAVFVSVSVAAVVLGVMAVAVAAGALGVASVAAGAAGAAGGVIADVVGAAGGGAFVPPQAPSARARLAKATSAMVFLAAEAIRLPRRRRRASSGRTRSSRARVRAPRARRRR